MRIVFSEPDADAVELLAPLVQAASRHHQLGVLCPNPGDQAVTIVPLTEMQGSAPTIDAEKWHPDVVIARTGDDAATAAATQLAVPWIEMAIPSSAAVGNIPSMPPPAARIVQVPPSLRSPGNILPEVSMQPWFPVRKDVPLWPFPPSDFQARLVLLSAAARSTVEVQEILGGLPLAELQVLVESLEADVGDGDAVRRALPPVRRTGLIGGADVVVSTARFSIVVHSLVRGRPLAIVPGTEEENALAARLERAGAGLRASGRADVGKTVRSILRQPRFFARAQDLGHDILAMPTADEALTASLFEAIVGPMSESADA